MNRINRWYKNTNVIQEKNMVIFKGLMKNPFSSLLFEGIENVNPIEKNRALVNRLGLENVLNTTLLQRPHVVLSYLFGGNPYLSSVPVVYKDSYYFPLTVSVGGKNYNGELRISNHHFKASTWYEHLKQKNSRGPKRYITHVPNSVTEAFFGLSIICSEENRNSMHDEEPPEHVVYDVDEVIYNKNFNTATINQLKTKLDAIMHSVYEMGKGIKVGSLNVYDTTKGMFLPQRPKVQGFSKETEKDIQMIRKRMAAEEKIKAAQEAKEANRRVSHSNISQMLEMLREKYGCHTIVRTEDAVQYDGKTYDADNDCTYYQSLDFRIPKTCFIGKYDGVYYVFSNRKASTPRKLQVKREKVPDGRILPKFVEVPLTKNDPFYIVKEEFKNQINNVVNVPEENTVETFDNTPINFNDLNFIDADIVEVPNRGRFKIDIDNYKLYPMDGDNVDYNKGIDLVESHIRKIVFNEIKKYLKHLIF